MGSGPRTGWRPSWDRAKRVQGESEYLCPQPQGQLGSTGLPCPRRDCVTAMTLQARVPPSWQDLTSCQACRSKGCWGTGLGCYHTSGSDQTPVRKPHVHEGLGRRLSPGGWG